MVPFGEFFSRRGILVDGVPSSVLVKARRIITSLEAGTPYWKLRGKRMQFNRYVISIPVGNTWRILAEDRAGRVRAKQVLSHSRYNHRLAQF